MKRLFILLLVLLSFHTSFSQTTYTWNGSASTAWDVSTNWTPNGIPQSGDHVVIQTGTNQPSIGSSRSVTNFRINSGTLDLSGGTLNATGVSTIAGGTITNGTMSSTGSSVAYGAVTLTAVINDNCASVSINGTKFYGDATITSSGRFLMVNTYFDKTANLTRSDATSGISETWGGNTFNGVATINSNCGNQGGMMMGYVGNDTFNSLVTLNVIAGSGLTTSYRYTTYFNGDIRVNANGGGLAFTGDPVYNGTGKSVLADGKTIAVGSSGFTGGILYLRNFTQTGTKPQHIETNGQLTIENSVFQAPVDLISPNLNLRKSEFFLSTLLQSTGTGRYLWSEGGNTFHAPVEIKNTSTGWWVHASANPDIFQSDLTVTLTNADGGIYLAHNSPGNQFGGDVIFNNTSTSGWIFIGQGANATVTLANGKTLRTGPGGIGGAGVFIQRVTQTGTTPVSMTATGTAYIQFGSNNTINGNMTLQAPLVAFTGAGSVYNGTVAANITNFSGNLGWTGVQVFNNDVVITNTSTNPGSNLMLGFNNTDLFKFYGNLTINRNSNVGILAACYSNFELYKDLTYNYTGSLGGWPYHFGYNGGTCKFLGSNPQKVSSNNPAGLEFYSITVDKPANNVTFTTPVYMEPKPWTSVRAPILTLNSGNIITSSSAVLTLSNIDANGNIINANDNGPLSATNDVLVGGSANSFVDGPMVRRGTYAFTFPIGKGKVYMPMSMTTPSTSSVYQAEAFAGDPATLGAVDPTLVRLANCQYWNFKRTYNNGSTVSIILTWNTQTCTSVVPSALTTATLNGTKWTTSGANNAVNNGTNGNITTNVITGAGSYFALASPDPCASPAPAKTFYVSTTSDAGPGSLRAAIDACNATPATATDKNKIIICASLPSPYTINLATALADIKQPVVIDGTVNSAQNLIINGGGLQLNGLTVRWTNVDVKNIRFTNFSAGGTYGIRLNGSSCTVQSCTFDNCNQALLCEGSSNTFLRNVFNANTSCIFINGNDNVVFPSNKFKGSAITGWGLYVNTNAARTIIGGEITSTDLMNTFEGFVTGIHDNGVNTQIIGNLIGGPSKLNSVDCSGPGYGSANAWGIMLHTTGATVGKAGQSHDRFANIIIGNNNAGIQINGTGNSIVGNYIGVDKYSCTPSTTPTRTPYGINIIAPADRTVIGSVAGTTYNDWDANIIGNQKNGILIASGTANQINGNYIGTDRNNRTGIGNDIGVYFDGTTDNTRIDGNIISGNVNYGVSSLARINFTNNKVGTTKDGKAALANGNSGVFLFSADTRSAANSVISNNLISGNSYANLFTKVDNVTITGNKIGTNIDGTASIGTQGMGIYAYGKGWTIGGATASARNIISGNTYGIQLQTASNGVIQGNYIGTNIDATQTVANGTGIYINTDCSGIKIGGDQTKGEGNVLCGNGTAIRNDGQSCIIKGNYIGITPSGATLANNRCIDLANGAAYNIIGSTVPGEANTIANNSGYGVYLYAVSPVSHYNTISGNKIYNNTSGAIKLNYGTYQGNDGKPVPVITFAGYTGTLATFKGTAQAGDIIELFSSETTGKNAYNYIGQGTADAQGNWTITVNLPTPDKFYITTATGNSTGNTSELSLAKALVNVPVVSDYYVKMKKELDGDFVLVPGTRKLKIRFDEEYNVAGADKGLQYKIYDFSNKAVDGHPDPSLLVQYGYNKYDINVASLVAGNYYLLEVKNQKGEKWLLRFKVQ